MPKSKSAYSVPTKKEKPETYIFVVWVDNEAGVLARVVGLFSGRGYNIESLAVAEVDAIKNIFMLSNELYDTNYKLHYFPKIDIEAFNGFFRKSTRSYGKKKTIISFAISGS